MITVRKICQLILIAACVCVFNTVAKAADVNKFFSEIPPGYDFNKVGDAYNKYYQEAKNSGKQNAEAEDIAIKKVKSDMKTGRELGSALPDPRENSSLTGVRVQVDPITKQTKITKEDKSPKEDNSQEEDNSQTATNQASNAGAGTNTPPSESAVTGCSSNYGLFSGLISTGSKIFRGLRDLIYVVAGFGIIGVAVGGFFGNLNWKWLGAIVISLVVIATTGELINLITGCDNFTSAAITDTLK